MYLHFAASEMPVFKGQPLKQREKQKQKTSVLKKKNREQPIQNEKGTGLSLKVQPLTENMRGPEMKTFLLGNSS